MKYELVGTPPQSDAIAAVRRDFEALIEDLEASPTKRVSVVFGCAWGNDIYERDWLALEVSGAELRARVAAAEAGGLGRIGSDDLHITLPDVGVERMYCHEADIHVIAPAETHPYLDAQRKAWIRSGWQVHEGELT